jgi:transcriptional regulator with XRE-family HTH domain
MINYAQIGIRIKQLRESDSRKWNPADFATQLGKKDKEIVRLYEKGKSLTLQIIEKIAALFNVSEEYLLFGRVKEAIALQDLPPTGMDPRAPIVAANFSWLNEPEKKKTYFEVKSMADANKVMLKHMIGDKITPPPDEYVDKKLNRKAPERRGRDGKQ